MNPTLARFVRTESHGLAMKNNYNIEGIVRTLVNPVGVGL